MKTTQNLRSPFDRINGRAHEWASDVLDAVGGFDDVTSVRLEEVENHSRSGFIAYTAGGYDGIGYGCMRHAHGSGCVPAVIQPYIDSSIKECDAAWNEANPEHTTEWLYADSLEDAGQTTLRHRVNKSVGKRNSGNFKTNTCPKAERIFTRCGRFTTMIAPRLVH